MKKIYKKQIKRNIYCNNKKKNISKELKIIMEKV